MAQQPLNPRQRRLLTRRRFLTAGAAASAGIASGLPRRLVTEQAWATSARALGPVVSSQATQPLNVSNVSVVALETGSPFPDNPYEAAEFTTFARPPAANDTRAWDVFGGDLGILYDGLDGNVYGLLGDTFGSNWTGPDVAPRGTGHSTLSPLMTGVNVSSFTGTQSITINTVGNFTASGGCAVVALSSNSTLAYIRYASRTATTLNNCRLLFGHGTMLANDVIRGDDHWPGARRRSNTVFRTRTADLSSGFTIDQFQNLSTGTAPGIARQAIRGQLAGKGKSTVFHPSCKIAKNGISVASNVVTVTTTAAHNLHAGQPVVVAGVANSAFNGNFTVTSVLSTKQFAYALQLADTASTGGTVIGQAKITNIAVSNSVATVDTLIPHNLIPFQGVRIAGTGVADGEFLVVATPSATRFTYTAYVANANAATGTVQPAVNVWVERPGGAPEATVIPSGAVAIDIGGGTIRHVAFYQDITVFGSTFYTNYMGIAYSDDAANTWVRVGVTGNQYQDVDVTKVWGNNATYTDRFQAAYPVDGGDGYIYLMCNQSGRSGDAYMMRVAKADVLTKSAYTYWNGSAWDTSAAGAVPIFPDTAHQGSPVGEPSFRYHPGLRRYVACYLDIGSGVGIVVRTAPAPQGPWSAKLTVVFIWEFGNRDMYGGFLHPWSGVAPNAPNDIYFMLSLYRPYNTHLIRATLS